MPRYGGAWSAKQPVHHMRISLCRTCATPVHKSGLRPPTRALSPPFPQVLHTTHRRTIFAHVLLTAILLTDAMNYTPLLACSIARIQALGFVLCTFRPVQ